MKRAYTNDGSKLTRKQKAFADYLLANPKQSATQAVKQTYPVTTQGSAEVQASRLLGNAKVQAYLDIHANTASETVLEVIKQSRDKMKGDNAVANAWANTALTASKDILDRVHGKATQTVNQNTSVVSLSISLSDITQQQR